MVNVNFIGEDRTMFDDIEYSWKVTDRLQTFIVTATFCGGIDEDGNKNLYSCINCDITIQETQRSKSITDSNILGILLNRLDIVAESIDEDKNRLQMLCYKNEDSFDSTINDIKNILKELTGILIENRQVAIDPVLD